MSVEITPLTELEAVNAILATIGETPLNSLENLNADGELARYFLKSHSAQTQVKGWTFNTEEDYSLEPNSSGEIWLPSNTLKFLTSDHTIVQRGLRLYDRAKHSYTSFATAITADLVVGLPFEELPETLRQYLTLAAGRAFQDSLEGERVTHEISSRDELVAWATFMNYEAEVGGYNMLSNYELTLRLKGARS